jgi:chromosome segregation ATPase
MGERSKEGGKNAKTNKSNTRMGRSKKQKASKTLDPVQTLDKEIEQLQAETMRMRIAYDRKQKQNTELKRMVSVHITQGKKRAEWSYKQQEAKRSIRLRQNEITKAADILNKRLTANRELLQELNELRKSRAHADSTYVGLAKEEANVSRQCAQLETKLQQMHIEHRKLSNRIDWMKNKADDLEKQAEQKRKDNTEVIREERRRMEAEARRQTEAAADDDDDELSVVSSEPSVEGKCDFRKYLTE